jgi:EAL domain-containing protein (putative c-di-GMP-specific phosphodiesterase class I)
MEAPRQRRAKIERALQLHGIYDDIHVVFQPIFDLRTGQIIAQEALARWTDEELGDVSPAEFVPIAEQLDVIGRLSDSLFDKAVKEAAQWPAAVRLSFNLSAIQICSAGSADGIIRTLTERGVSPERLQVEVTEITLLADFQQARANLLKLRSAGVSLVLDDFGAGHASISNLREIRFDQVKLDGSLVKAAEECPERQRLLGAVIGLCQALDVPAVAEHVETEEQLKLLLELGCGAGQGYWLHRPISSDAAREVSSHLSFPHPPRAKRPSLAA